MPENSPPSLILVFALQAMLASRLQKALNSQEFSSFLPKRPSDLGELGPDSAQNHRFETVKSASISAVRLKRTISADKIRYASPIALQLARSSSEAVLVAAAIRYSLFQSIQSIPEQNTEAQIWHRCALSVDLQGWLSLELSDIGIAVWLEGLWLMSLTAEIAPANVAKITASRSQAVAAADLFTVLYSHGRCCSLLRRYVQTDEPRWLIGVELRCQQATERRLIAAIADTLDYLSASANQPLIETAALKVALQLSQAFEAFYAACRLPWPDSTASAPDLLPDLLEVRLGLVAIVRALLQILLERLAVSAPTQL